MICCSGCFDTPDGILDSLWRQSEGEWFCPACVDVFGVKDESPSRHRLMGALECGPTASPAGSPEKGTRLHHETGDG